MIVTASGSGLRNRRLGVEEDTNFDPSPICDYNVTAIHEMNENVKSTLLKRGFSVREGHFAVGDTPMFGSNPGNPYLVYLLDEEVPFNPMFKMNASSAVLFLGCTPSATKYFSWRSYAFKSKWATVFASLGDSINNMMINTTQSGAYWENSSSGDLEEDPFGKLTAMVTTADGGTLSSITTALTEAGAPSGIVNLDAVPSNRVDMLRDRSLEFMMLHRANVWSSEKRKRAYHAQVRRVFLIDPPLGQEFDPLPEIPLREQGSGSPEAEQDSVKEGLAKLQDAIVSTFESASYRFISNTTMVDSDKDGFECLEQRKNCKGDNRDTNYIKYISDKPFKKKDVYVFFGTNSVATGKCTYTSIGLYQVEYVHGVETYVSSNITVDDSRMEHSASAYGVDNDKLVAYALARNCDFVPLAIRDYCIKIGYDPTEELPSKMAWALAYRPYLDPQTMTAPLPKELVMPQILKFQPEEV